MAYKIFISHSNEEYDLANALSVSLNNAFRGEVQFFMFANEVLAGDKWKIKLKNALDEHDAILTILSPLYIKSPWAYIEWTAFWLADKTSYIVQIGGIQVDEVISPMADNQIIDLLSDTGIEKLIRAIAKNANVKSIPYDFVSVLANTCRQEYDKNVRIQENKTYLKYKNDISLLPNEDTEKKSIFIHVYNINKDRAFLEVIFEKINENSIKENLLLFLIEKLDFALVERVFQYIQTKSYLKSILKKLNENGYVDLPVTTKILEYVSESQTSLRSFGEYLVLNGNIGDKLFLDVLGLFRNMSELRRLAELMIENSLQHTASFEQVIENFYGKNHAELQKLLIILIRSDSYDEDRLIKYTIRLSQNNTKETFKVLVELSVKNRKLLKTLMANTSIKLSADDTDRLQELLLEDS